jgi:hypothetical protein
MFKLLTMRMIAFFTADFLGGVKKAQQFYRIPHAKIPEMEIKREACASRRDGHLAER